MHRYVLISWQSTFPLYGFSVLFLLGFWIMFRLLDHIMRDLFSFYYSQTEKKGIFHIMHQIVIIFNDDKIMWWWIIFLFVKASWARSFMNPVHFSWFQPLVVFFYVSTLCSFSLILWYTPVCIFVSTHYYLINNII